jgi:hypothetical protein
MEYIRRWIHNLFIDLVIVIVICIGTIIFMKFFYPAALSLMLLSGQFMIGMVNVLNLWPIVILVIIISAMPQRRSKYKYHNNQ